MLNQLVFAIGDRADLHDHLLADLRRDLGVAKAQRVFPYGTVSPWVQHYPGQLDGEELVLGLFLGVKLWVWENCHRTSPYALSLCCLRLRLATGVEPVRHHRDNLRQLGLRQRVVVAAGQS